MEEFMQYLPELGEFGNWLFGQITSRNNPDAPLQGGMSGVVAVGLAVLLGGAALTISKPKK